MTRYIATYQCRTCMAWVHQEVSIEQADLGAVVQAGGMFRVMAKMTERDIMHTCREGVIGIAHLMGIREEKGGHGGN